MKSALDPDQEKHLEFLRFWYVRHDASELPQPTKQEEEQLKSLLSQEARGVFSKAGSDAERSRIIQNWMRAADFSSRVPLASARRNWIDS